VNRFFYLPDEDSWRCSIPAERLADLDPPMTPGKGHALCRRFSHPCSNVSFWSLDSLLLQEDIFNHELRLKRTSLLAAASQNTH